MIYLDKESEKVVERLDVAKEWTISGFVQEKLKAETEKKVSKEDFISEINKLKANEIEIVNRRERTERLYRKWSERQELKEKDELKREVAEERQKEEGNYEVLKRLEHDKQLRVSGQLIEN